MAVVITYLEMRDRSWLRAAEGGPQFELRRVTEACSALNRFFYVEVGRAWAWTDRLGWSDEAWRDWVARHDLSTWIGWADGNPIGYAELEQQGRDVEIVYFGLLPQFIGRGFGGPMLTRVIESAWELEPARVWLHTCTLDHPAARVNYERRGFRRYKEEVAPPSPDPVGSS